MFRRWAHRPGRVGCEVDIHDRWRPKLQAGGLTIDQQVLDVHLVLDNYSTRRGPPHGSLLVTACSC